MRRGSYLEEKDNQIAFYQSPDGSVNIEVVYVEENIWLPQRRIVELFDTTPQNIERKTNQYFFIIWMRKFI